MRKIQMERREQGRGHRESIFHQKEKECSNKESSMMCKTVLPSSELRAHARIPEINREYLNIYTQ